MLTRRDHDARNEMLVFNSGSHENGETDNSDMRFFGYSVSLASV